MQIRKRRPMSNRTQESLEPGSENPKTATGPALRTNVGKCNVTRQAGDVTMQGVKCVQSLLQDRTNENS